MDELELADSFDRQRPQLRAVAYRILGSVSEAEDAVQEAWLRLRRTDAGQLDSLERWLTTVVARICLNMLRSRRTRGEQPLESFLPEPIIDNPAIGTVPSTRCCSRSRSGSHSRWCWRRSPQPSGSRSCCTTCSPCRSTRSRRWWTAHRRRPASSRAEPAAATVEVHGADQVAQGAMAARRFAPYVRPALINGTAGVVAFDGPRPFAVLAFTVVGDRAVAIDVFNDPELVAKLDIRGITA